MSIGDSSNPITANGNGVNGVEVDSASTVTVQNPTANGDGVNGFLHTGFGPQAVITVSNSSFGAPGAGNMNDGVDLYPGVGTGPVLGITLNSVTAGYNQNNGIENTKTITDSLTLTNVTTSNNLKNGLFNGGSVIGGLSLTPAISTAMAWMGFLMTARVRYPSAAPRPRRTQHLITMATAASPCRRRW